MPSGYDYGIAFTSVCINTSIYLPYLVSQCLAAGVIFKRAIFSHISEAAAVHSSGKPADVVVNCTGLSAGKLGGVEDKEMVPARGQTVLVRNDPGKMLGTSELAGEEMCYIMQRAAGKQPPFSFGFGDMAKADLMSRRRYDLRRLLPGRQLGLAIRSQPRE